MYGQYATITRSSRQSDSSTSCGHCSLTQWPREGSCPLQFYRPQGLISYDSLVVSRPTTYPEAQLPKDVVIGRYAATEQFAELENGRIEWRVAESWALGGRFETVNRSRDGALAQVGSSNHMNWKNSANLSWIITDSRLFLQVVQHYCRYGATAVMACIPTACVPAGLHAYTTSVTWTPLVIHLVSFGDPPTYHTAAACFHLMLVSHLSSPHVNCSHYRYTVNV